MQNKPKRNTMKKIFILIACGLAIQASSAFGMESNDFYSQPCYISSEVCQPSNVLRIFVPITNLSDLNIQKVYRIKGRIFGSSPSISMYEPDRIESIGAHDDKFKVAPANVTYDCTSGRWSDQSNPKKVSVFRWNKILWPGQTKIVFGNGGTPPKPKVVESPVVKKEPKIVEKEILKKEVDEKIASPEAKDSAGKKKTVKENEREAPKPKSESTGVSLSFTGKCFLLGGISLIGVAIFAAVKYAKKKKQESADAGQDFDQEQEPEALVN